MFIKNKTANDPLITTTITNIRIEQKRKEEIDTAKTKVRVALEEIEVNKKRNTESFDKIDNLLSTAHKVGTHFFPLLFWL